MPERLFHYQPFVSEHLKSLLVERKIKLSRPDSFNDPWDCRVHYKVPTESEDVKRYLDYFAVHHRKNFPHISEATRARMVYEFKIKPEMLASSLAQMDKEMYGAICKQYRVYCLTEKPDCALMWSHYAASHSGICLEFDAQHHPFTSDSGVTKIKYQKDYPAHDLVTVGYEPLAIKSDDWSYEVEWRLIAEERAFARAPLTLKTDNDFFILPVGALKAIIVGSLASEATRHEIRKLVSVHAPDTLIRQAAIAPDAYRLDIEPTI